VAIARAVAKDGETMDGLRPAQRATEAALRGRQQALRRHGRPETIPMEGSNAPAAALQSDNETPGIAIIIRQVPYGHQIVAQAHRGGKWVPRPRGGGNSVAAAHGTLVGIALRPMIEQKQRVLAAGDEGLPAADLCSSLAASSPHRQGQ
jgi:transposase-like protein